MNRHVLWIAVVGALSVLIGLAVLRPTSERDGPAPEVPEDLYRDTRILFEREAGTVELAPEWFRVVLPSVAPRREENRRLWSMRLDGTDMRPVEMPSGSSGFIDKFVAPGNPLISILLPAGAWEYCRIGFEESGVALKPDDSPGRNIRLWLGESFDKKYVYEIDAKARSAVRIRKSDGKHQTVVRWLLGPKSFRVSPHDGSLLYLRYADSRPNVPGVVLCHASPDGTAERILAGPIFDFQGFELTPDGESVLYAPRGQDYRLMNLKTRAQTPLPGTETCGSIELLPGGKQFLADCQDGKGISIFFYNGTQRTALTTRARSEIVRDTWPVLLRRRASQ